MNFWRRKTLLFCLGISIVLYIGFGIYMKMAEQNDKIYIEDIQGNREFLKGFLIEGTIGDDSHTRYVTIKNGEVFHRFIPCALKEEEEEWGNPDINLDYAPSPDEEMKVEERISNNATIEFPYAKKDEKILHISAETKKVDVYGEVNYYVKEDSVGQPYWHGVGGVRFNTGMQIEQDDPFVFLGSGLLENSDDINKKALAESSYEMKNRPKNFYCDKATIGNTDYFTVITGQECKGNNAIFKVTQKEGEDKYSTFDGEAIEEELKNSLYSEQEYGEVKRLVEIPLEGGVRTLGLERVGNQLLLMKHEGDRAVFELYNTSGKILSHLIMPKEVNPLLIAEYKTFVTNEKDKSILCIKAMKKTNEEDVFTNGFFAALMIKDDELVLDFLNTEGTGNVDFASEKDGKILIISYETGYKDDFLRSPEEVYFIIYEKDGLKGKLVYKGKLGTDIVDDYKKLLNGSFSDGDRSHKILGIESLIEQGESLRRAGDFHIIGGE